MEEAGALVVVEAGAAGAAKDTYHLLPESKGVSDAAFKEFYSALDDVLPTASARGHARHRTPDAAPRFRPASPSTTWSAAASLAPSWHQLRW